MKLLRKLHYRILNRIEFAEKLVLNELQATVFLCFYVSLTNVTWDKIKYLQRNKYE